MKLYLQCRGQVVPIRGDLNFADPVAVQHARRQRRAKDEGFILRAGKHFISWLWIATVAPESPPGMQP